MKQLCKEARSFETLLAGIGTNSIRRDARGRDECDEKGVRTGIRRGIHGMRPIAREVPHLARLIELLRSSTNVAYCASKILDELASDCVSRSTLVGDEDVDLAGPDIGELALQRRPLYVAAREPAIGICAADSVERADAELACPR